MTSSTRQQLIAAFLIFFIFGSSVSASFPAKLEPKIILNVTESGNYSIFVGLEDSSDTNPLLEDVHGLKKINGRFYVYSRSYIFLLNPLITPVSKFSSLYYSQAFNWTVENERYNTCKTIISRTVRQCQSHVMSFNQLKHPKTNQLTNTVAACSTFGYYPKLQNFKLEKDGKISLSGKPKDAKLFCPYVPDHKMSAISTSGYIYTAFRKFFGGTMSGIVKRQTSESHETLYGSIPTSNTFNDNSDFIKTIETDDRILIFFNEIAIEERDHRKLPRVAQVCKNDFGHENLFFTSLFKSRLNCSLTGASPLYFDDLRSVSDVITMTSKDGEVIQVVMAVMQIPHDTIRASAICVFALEDIKNALLSPFFIQSEQNPDSWIVPRTNKHSNLASCSSKSGINGVRNLTEDESVFSQMHSLVSESVKSRDAGSNFEDLRLSTPLLITHGLNDALTTIATDDEFVTTNDSKIVSHLVILAGTENGDVIKAMLLTSSHRLVTLERRQVFNEEKCGKDSDRSVRSILLDKPSGNMYVSFVDCIMVLPLCPFNTDCEKECIESRDPYCRWNGHRCVTVMPDDVDREQDLDSTDPTRLEECKVIVPVTLKQIKTTDTTTSVPEDKVQLAVVGSSEVSQVILACCGGLLIGILISSIIFYCCNPCHHIQQKEHLLKSRVARVNSNRHDSETSVTTKRSKHPSESSNKGHRISIAPDDVTLDTTNRKRHVTETSTNSDASEGRKPQSRHNSAKTPDNPNQSFAGDVEKRRSRKTSMSSARAPTQPSTSSNQENEPNQLLEVNNEVFYRQSSNDSNERQKLLAEKSSGVNNNFPGFIASDPRQIHGSFPNAQPLLRTASFGPGIPPKGRQQIGRQLSFQAPTRPRDLILSNGSPIKQQWISKTPMPPPTSSMVPKAMTYSLDRRTMKPHLMTPSGHLITPSERDYKSHKRQRYASETQHQAYNHGTILSYPIIEESGFFHDPAGNRALREGLKIDLRPDRRRVYVQASPAGTPVYDDRNSLRKNPFERLSSGFQPPIKHVTPVHTPVDIDPSKVFDPIPMTDLKTPSISDRKSVHSSTSSSAPESSEALSSPEEEKEIDGYLHPTEIVA